jgi:hypothetical protein
MRPRLLFEERDVAFDGASRRARERAARASRAARSPSVRALVQDLELATLIDAMAAGDAFVGGVAEHVLLEPLAEPSEIRYRHDVLHDCLAHPDAIRELYALATASIERAHKVSWGFMPRRPEAIVRHSHDLLQTFLASFRALRRFADVRAERFTAPGLRRFFAMLATELDDAYLAEVERHLRELRFDDGVWLSARLGGGNRGAEYVVRRSPTSRLSRWRWLARLGRTRPVAGVAELTYRLHTRDEPGLRALAELQDRGLAPLATVLARASQHVLGFFAALRSETAFYVGCLNLSERLAQLGAATCFPEPVSRRQAARAARGLYDPCLQLRVGQRVVDNDVAADGAALVVITGANQGGKTTFLRSVGLAQLMMQSGMFVAARGFRASVAPGIFTHFKREEDATMTSGKLDEELVRMSAIADELSPDSLLLLNESFSATNEREGSEIARQIVRAVTEAGATVFFVTHLTDFAHERYEHARLPSGRDRFLLAERRPDGTRTFKLREGAPERTSHGADLYRTIFAGDDALASGDAAAACGADDTLARAGDERASQR